MLFAGFFLVVLATVLAAGYAVLRTRAISEGAVVEIAASDQPIVTQALQSLGETLPIRGKQANALRVRLFRAGYRDPAAITVFQGGRAAIALIAALLALWAASGNPEGSMGSSLLGAIAAGGLGTFLPERWLDWRVGARSQRIRSALAPALEMITLAVEAGQSLDASIQNTAAALRRVHPDLCDELTFYLLETRAGASRLEALSHLSERSPEPEVKKLASVLTDAERFGTNLGPALRTHSKFLRAHMRFQAQAAARKLSVKLVFPVFFLIFPAVLLVTLGPAYLQMQQFFGALLK